MTSSARARINGGAVNPSAFAVFRLTTNSNIVGCWTGRSAGDGLALIAALDGLRFVAFDINTVSPPHDVGGMSAFLAASCLQQFLILLCKQLRSTQP